MCSGDYCCSIAVVIAVAVLKLIQLLAICSLLLDIDAATSASAFCVNGSAVHRLVFACSVAVRLSPRMS